MAVESRPLTSTKQSTQPHVVEADTLSKAQPYAYRFIAFGLILLSYLGTVFAFDNGDSLSLVWRLWQRDPRLMEALAWAFGFQLICTILQLIFCKPWTNWVYLLTILASAGSSFIGYRVLVAVPLAEWMSGAKGDVFAKLSWHAFTAYQLPVILWSVIVSLVVFGIFIAVDVIPERILVKH